MMKTTTYVKGQKAFLRKELREYMLTFGDMTQDEKNDLHEWVASGNSVYANPYCYSDDRGYPMDYITAMRFNDEFLAGDMGPLQAYSAEDDDLSMDDDFVF